MKKILVIGFTSLVIISLFSIGIFAKGNDYDCLDSYRNRSYRYIDCVNKHNNCFNNMYHNHHKCYNKKNHNCR